MSTTKLDEMLEKITAVQIKTESKLSKLADDLNALRMNTENHLLSCTTIRDTAQNTSGWGWVANPLEMYETLTTNALKGFLRKEGFEDIEELHNDLCRLPSHVDEDGSYVPGVEWDGVITAVKDVQEYLFLLEAKKTQSFSHMRDMPERVVRTERFIKNSLFISEKTLSKRDKALCYQWSLFSSNIVQGVLVVDVLPEEAMAMVYANRYIAIEDSNDGLKNTKHPVDIKKE